MLPRLLLAFTILLWAMLASSLMLMVLLGLLSVLLLCWRGAKALLFWRSLRLLLWLCVPIVLLQGIFSSGTYVQTPFTMPVTVEGLQRALFLCLHLLLMFFSALACFRLLGYTEWLACVYAFPSFAQVLQPYLLLLPALRHSAQHILQQQRQIWQQKQQAWLHFPALCVQSLEQLLRVAHAQAHELWHDWQQREITLLAQQQALPILATDYKYIAILVVGWSIFWLV